MSDVCRESGFMSDVCREWVWGIRLMGSGHAERMAGILAWVWMTMRRAVHVPAAGLWPRTLIVIFKVRGSGGVKHAFLSVKFKILILKSDHYIDQSIFSNSDG